MNEPKNLSSAKVTNSGNSGLINSQIKSETDLKREIRPKFGNKRTNGYASKREAQRAADLQLLLKIGEISDLQEQVKFELIPKQEGERAVTYTADFVYRDKSGEVVVEDSKGMKTQQYIIRRKLMLFIHKIRVREV